MLDYNDGYIRGYCDGYEQATMDKQLTWLLIGGLIGCIVSWICYSFY